MPGGFPAALTESSRGCEARAGSSPFEGWIPTQPSALEAVHFSVPEPVLLMLRAEGASVPPSSAAVNETLVGLTPIFGMTLMFRVTRTFLGELLALGAVTVTSPT